MVVNKKAGGRPGRVQLTNSISANKKQTRNTCFAFLLKKEKRRQKWVRRSKRAARIERRLSVSLHRALLPCILEHYQTKSQSLRAQNL